MTTTADRTETRHIHGPDGVIPLPTGWRPVHDRHARPRWITTTAAGMSFGVVTELTPAIARAEVYAPDGMLLAARDHRTPADAMEWATARRTAADQAVIAAHDARIEASR